jgi:hypothetical protein
MCRYRPQPIAVFDSACRRVHAPRFVSSRLNHHRSLLLTFGVWPARLVTHRSLALWEGARLRAAVAAYAAAANILRPSSPNGQ